MGKLVVLKLHGDFQERGFEVSLEIATEGQRSTREVTGHLPANPELLDLLQRHWQENYRSLESTYRIKPKAIIRRDAIQQRLQECQKSAHLLRQKMAQWLQSEPFQAINMQLRQALDPHETVRVLIRSNDEQLQKLPWHLWDFFEQYEQAEAALSALEFKQIEQPDRLAAKLKVKILAILGHQEGIDVETDRQLLAALPNADVTFLVEPQRQAINDQLWNQPWDIIFFAGHSETEGETGLIYINPEESLTVDDLWFGLRSAVNRGLKLAIFNSCDGLGLARRLDDLHIPQMVVMRELVPDVVAQAFLKGFLTAFSQGQPFYLAVRQAREQLQGLEGQFPCASWLPVIFQNPAERPPIWEELVRQPEPILPEPAKRSEWWGVRTVLLSSLLATGLVMGGRSLGILQPLELKAFDHLMTLRPSQPPDQRILVITVDEKDKAYQSEQGMSPKEGWSLSDKALLRLLKKISQRHPKAIGLNISHPFQFEGQELQEIVKKTNHFIGACYVGGSNVAVEDATPPPGIPIERLGFMDGVADSDNVIRRQILQIAPGKLCHAKYSLSLQLVHTYLAQEGREAIQQRRNGQLQLEHYLFEKLNQNSGGYELASNAIGSDYQVLLDYRYASPETISLRKLLSGSLDEELPNLIDSRIILIGVDQPWQDRSKSIRGDNLSGVIFHAHMVSQLLDTVLLGRTLTWWFPQWIETFWIASWTFISGMAIQSSSSIIRKSISCLLIAFGLYVFCFIVLLMGGWIPIVPQILTFFVTIFISLVTRNLSGLTTKLFAKNACL